MSEQPAQLPDPLHMVQPAGIQYWVGEIKASNGQRVVTLRFDHTTGCSVFILPFDHAARLGEQLIAQAAESSKPSLVVPQTRMPDLRDVLGHRDQGPQL